MIYKITHTTTYSYDKLVSLCHNLVHLTPRQTASQKSLERELNIAPEPTLISEQHDYFGNAATYFTIEEPHMKLEVQAINMVEVKRATPLDLAASTPWETVADALAEERSPDHVSAYEFVFDSPYVKSTAQLAAYADPSFTQGRPLLEAANHLMHRIHKEFRYDPTATMVTTTVDEALKLRRGVCQDFAHLMIGCLRSLGLAVRYTSGYLRTHPRPGQPRLIGADASHAWVSVYDPRTGWADFDPTNGLMPTDEHILLAWGRDYDDVSPIKGVNLGGGEHAVNVTVDVAPQAS